METKSIKTLLTSDVKRQFFDSNDVILNLMYYYSSNLDDVEKIGRLSQVDYLYKTLGWDNNKYFDCIYSFWTLFSYGFLFIGHDDRYYVTEMKNIKNIYKKSLYENGSTPEKYIQNIGCVRQDVNSVITKFPSLLFLAERYHTVSNFMPCPDRLFNKVKGQCGIGDFLNLFVDKIQGCLNESRALRYDQDNEISVEKLEEWKNFLIDKREEYSLSREYRIENGSLVGERLFDTQSLENPLPTTKNEYEQCIKTVEARLSERVNDICS